MSDQQQAQRDRADRLAAECCAWRNEWLRRHPGDTPNEAAARLQTPDLAPVIVAMRAVDAAGDLPHDAVRRFALTEMSAVETGKVYRILMMTPAQAAAENKGMHVLEWLPAGGAQ